MKVCQLVKQWSHFCVSHCNKDTYIINYKCLAYMVIVDCIHSINKLSNINFENNFRTILIARTAKLEHKLLEGGRGG